MSDEGRERELPWGRKKISGKMGPAVIAVVGLILIGIQSAALPLAIRGTAAAQH